MKPSYEEMELALWRTNLELCRANAQVANLMQEKLIPMIQNRERELADAAATAALEKANGE